MDVSLQRTILFSVLLSGILFILIPILYVSLDIPVLITVPVFFTIFALIVFNSGYLFEGLISLFYTCLLLNANVPLLIGPMFTRLDIMIIDPIMLLIVIFFVYNINEINANFYFDRLGILAIASGFIFVTWTLFSTIVNNGGYPLAAIIFSMERIRYLVAMIVTILLVQNSSIFHILYPLSISIFGNMLLSVLQLINSGPFGMTYLGESTGRIFTTVSIGVFNVSTGQYAGGFVGRTRILLAMFMILLPILFLLLSNNNKVARFASVMGILYIVIYIWIAKSSTGAGTVIVLAVLFCTIKLSRNNIPIQYVRIILITGAVFIITFPFFLSRVSILHVASQLEQYSGIFGNLVVRLIQYEVAWNLTREYPIFGIGGYNFQQISQEYINNSFLVHNSFFSHLVATGFVGFLFYILFSFTVMYKSALAIIYFPDRLQKYWITISLSLVGFHIFSFWEVVFHVHPNIILWVYSGVVIGSVCLPEFDSSV